MVHSSYWCNSIVTKAFIKNVCQVKKKEKKNLLLKIEKQLMHIQYAHDKEPVCLLCFVFSVFLSICMFVLFLFFLVFLSVSVFVCLSDSLSLCLSVCLPRKCFCKSASLYTWLLISLFVSLSLFFYPIL